MDQAQRSYQAEKGASGATLGCRSPYSAPIARAVGRIAMRFPRRSAKSAVTGDQGLLAGVCARADLADCRIHDLRHTYASILASAGLSLPVIGALLGHTQPGTTARYSHLFDDPLREATERVGAVVAPIAASTDVKWNFGVARDDAVPQSKMNASDDAKKPAVGRRDILPESGA
jgi:hypothetical protein